MQIIENTRSGVIHTRLCGNVQQMKKENMKTFEIDSEDEINTLSICEHCRIQEQLERIHEKEVQTTLKTNKAAPSMGYVSPYYLRGYLNLVEA